MKFSRPLIFVLGSFSAASHLTFAEAQKKKEKRIIISGESINSLLISYYLNQSAAFRKSEYSVYVVNDNKFEEGEKKAVMWFMDSNLNQLS